MSLVRKQMNKDLQAIPEMVGLKIADVGAASKPVKKFIKMRDCEYITFDIKDADEIIDLSWRFDYKKGNEYFDVAFCLEVFEHLKGEFENAVANLKRLLKPEGILYFAMPAYGFPEHGVEYWRMHEKTIRSLFEYDFEILEFKTYYPTAGLKEFKAAFEKEEIEVGDLAMNYLFKMKRK